MNEKEIQKFCHHASPTQKDKNKKNKIPKSLNSLYSEVKCLKNKIIDSIVEVDLPKTLRENDSDAAELEKCLLYFTQKLNEFKQQYQKEKSSIKMKIKSEYKQKIDEMRQEHITKINDMEKNFKQQLSESEQKIQEMYEQINDEHNKKITQMKTDYEQMLQTKEDRIKHLENLLETKSDKIQDELNLIAKQLNDVTTVTYSKTQKKIEYLQKYIKKLDELYRKAEADHIKEITKLKKYVSTFDQKKQFLSPEGYMSYVEALNAKMQSEIDTIFHNLEQHYKIMLENQQQQAFAEKKEDQIIIHNLKLRLAAMNKVTMQMDDNV